MKAAQSASVDDPVSEMAIVDTFTKLIFGEEGEFSSSQELIVEALRLVDTRVELDSYKDMGDYLRALGVQEMIQLVTRVQWALSGGIQSLSIATAEPVGNPRTH